MAVELRWRVMPDRPSLLWKRMPLETRLAAADAFWRDEESPDIQAQHAEAMLSLARRLNFRPKTLQSLPAERLAKHLAQMAEVSDAIATRALIALHFSDRRALMSAFLDALGISHDNGLITAEDVGAPPVDRLLEASNAVRSSFDAADVDLYLRTLAALDGDTWGNLDKVVAPLQ
jgi:hypothetical protein